MQLAKTRPRSVALLLAVLLTAGPAFAVLPDEKLADPVLEARARAISKELRCLVCQNESIDASNAGLARDLRLLVRERLGAGDTDEQVVAFVHDRYGDFVLLRPPVKPETWGLWFGPALVLLLGGAGAVVYLRRRPPAATGADTVLTEAEEARLAALLDGMERGEDGSRPGTGHTPDGRR